MKPAWSEYVVDIIKIIFGLMIILSMANPEHL